MKASKFFIITIALAAAAISVSCNKAEDVFQRDVDKVEASCMKQTLSHYILCTGDWTIENNVPWITISPDSGTGDGVLFQEYKISLDYNSAYSPRTEIFYIVHNCTKSAVTVTQGPCDFAWGQPVLNGSLTKGEASSASIYVPYIDASGDENVSFSVTLGGASAGLSVENLTALLAAGNGTAVLPITGTPAKAGEVTFAVSVDGKSIGTATATIAGTNDPSGIPCGWNFYDIGYTGDNASEVASTSFGQDWVPSPHRVYPTHGDNADAYFTAVSAVGCTNWTFNPSIQAQALKLDDYWLAYIPVKNFPEGGKITVDMGCGGAGGSVGFYYFEYSVDGTTWKGVPGAKECTRGTDTFLAHLWNTGSSISASGYTNTRKTYDKATDDTYQKYTFAVDGLTNGVLYLRLRVLKYRATPGSTADNNGTGWTDIKGFEVNWAE